MAVRNKGEVRRERKPLPIILAAIAAAALLAAGLMLLRPLSHSLDNQAEPAAPVVLPDT